MRAPSKLNRSFWPRIFWSFFSSADDPRVLLQSSFDTTDFSRAVSVFKFGSTFKTTKKSRFPCTIDVLSNLTFTQQPIILDVGASDGVTSLDVIRSLDFKDYYITDLNTEALWSVSLSRRGIFFYNTNGYPILYANRYWIIYNEPVGAISPFGALVRRIFSDAPTAGQSSRKISLINPELQTLSGKNIIVRRYDIFSKWNFDKAHLVIAANILNRSYFSDSELRDSILNLQAALLKDGYLAIIDNRAIEKATIFKKSGEIVRQINGGTEIEALVLGCLLQKI
jgi:hypothetical protein